MTYKRLTRLTRKIVKVCMTPDDFCSEYIHGAGSDAEVIRRLKEYVACVRKVEREYKKKLK